MEEGRSFKLDKRWEGKFEVIVFRRKIEFLRKSVKWK